MKPTPSSLTASAPAPPSERRPCRWLLFRSLAAAAALVWLCQACGNPHSDSSVRTVSRWGPFVIRPPDGFGCSVEEDGDLLVANSDVPPLFAELHGPKELPAGLAPAQKLNFVSRKLITTNARVDRVGGRRPHSYRWLRCGGNWLYCDAKERAHTAVGILLVGNFCSLVRVGTDAASDPLTDTRVRSVLAGLSTAR